MRRRPGKRVILRQVAQSALTRLKCLFAIPAPVVELKNASSGTASWFIDREEKSAAPKRSQDARSDRNRETEQSSGAIRC
jgi:hypothetical protein